MPDIPNPSVPVSAPSPQTPPTEGRPSVAADARVVVRPMPKVIFFYLTWLASLVMGIIAAATSGTQPEHLGTVWMCIFAFNLLVIAFDFTEVISIASVFGILVVVFAGLYFKFLGFIGTFFQKLDISMNSGFYFAVFGIFSIIYAIIFVKSRFEYWEFRHNEVLHRAGMFGEIKRYSTEDLRWFKQIPDVLERILLKSGRMVLTTPREPSPIVLEHVIGIEGADEKIAELLGTKRVTFQ